MDGVFLSDAVVVMMEVTDEISLWTNLFLIWLGYKFRR